MAGAILQLVTNTGIGNKWLNQDPQITYFKRVYRRHTPFATDHLRIPLNSPLNFNQNSKAIILPQGDLLHRLFICFEIPEIATAFLNTKSTDLIDVINSSILSDELFITGLRKFVNGSQQVEFPRIFNLISNTLSCYDKEEKIRLEIIKELNNEIKIPGYNPYDPFMISETPTGVVHDLYNFFNFKLSLGSEWVNKKEQYHLIYNFIKLIYISEQGIINNTPMINTNLLTEVIMYSSIFYNMIPNREILLMYYMKNQDFTIVTDQTINSLIETFNIELTNLHTNLVEKFDHYEYLNDLYNSSETIRQVLNKEFKINFLALDTYTFLKQLSFSLDNQYAFLKEVQDQFYNFGPSFCYLLNTYNTIIKIIDNLAKTTPIVICRAFGFATNIIPNIYQDTNNYYLMQEKYPTFSDPNFKTNLLFKINDLEKPEENDYFIPIDYLNTYDEMYPNRFVNQYLQLFNEKTIFMFNNIERFMDKLFIRYKNSLFSETKKIFLYNTPPLMNIYSYITPTQSFIDDHELRVNNVFNMNIWFFYFFKYLDSFNEQNFVNYIISHITLSFNAQILMKYIITLLKINVEYYMNEISYMLNDMYASCPSSNTTDTMKNYCPPAYNNILNCKNVKTSLLATTMIFHRNHVQTILEMFEYIYYFIDHISYEQIQTHLGIQIGIINEEENILIRRLIKLFYFTIFGHFMNIYDSFKFESPANYSTNEFPLEENKIIKMYVNYFLLGTNLIPYQRPNQIQISLNEVIAQMEFYFVSEMINMRELQKMYYNVLFNEELIRSEVGATTAELINLIIKYLLKIDDNYEVNIEEIWKTKDPVRNYYDVLYQHNIIHGKPDNLYYSTFDLNRFNGKLYPYTSYKSRDYGVAPSPPNILPIPPPDPLPSIDPYGINPEYYDQKQVITDYENPPSINIGTLNQHIPVYWITGHTPTYNTQENLPSYQLFPFDYFRIKHAVFHNNPLSIPHDVKFIDQYQFNLLRSIKLTERLEIIYPERNRNLLYWVYISLYYVKINTISTIPYSNYLHLYNFGILNPTFVNMLNAYIINIKYSLEKTDFYFPRTLLTECLNGLREMFDDFNSSVIIQVDHQQPYYQYEDLILCNLYSYNNILYGKVFPEENIRSIIVIMRDNFLSEYFYFAKYEESIVKIERLGINNEYFTFRNISEINYEIIQNINTTNTDLSVLRDVSSLVYIYYDFLNVRTFPIRELQPLLDDFTQVISRSITSFLVPRSTPRFTFKDIYDMINVSFTSIHQAYIYCITHNYFQYISNILKPYQSLMIDKITLFDRIYNYIIKLPEIELMTPPIMVTLAQMAESFGINFLDFYNYLDIEIMPLFNIYTTTAASIDSYPYQRIMLISIVLYPQLDYFFLKWRHGAEITDYITTFKQYIMDEIFTFEFITANTLLYYYFGLVHNTYYSYFFYFFNYAYTHDLTIISNPLSIYDQYNYSQDQGYISTLYNSFKSLANILEYFLDLIWDWSMTICDKNPLYIENNFGYSTRFSIHVNQIHLENKFLIEEKKFLEKIIEDPIKRIIRSLEVTSDPFILAKMVSSNPSIKTARAIYPVDDYNQGVIQLNERTEIIKFIKNVAERGIVTLTLNREQIILLKNKIYNILYRNKRAKTAWVRKLAHFFIKQVTVRNDDQVLDTHVSDWFEVFHEISKHDGSEYGYQKMIGNRDDLITFDDNKKQSYLIVMPLIFYFNRNPTSALPLTSSLNSQFEITIYTRSLNDVIYKEQFSDFIDPAFYHDINNINVKPYIPTIKNSYLIGEYFYLSTEERKIFVTQQLEYLMEEIQIDDGFNITDYNLIPVYKIGSAKKTITTTRNGIRTHETFYNPRTTIYMDKYQLEAAGEKTERISENREFLPRNDHVLESCKDRTGVVKLRMINRPIPTDPLVHKKRINYQHYFQHPSELMVILIKLDLHIQPIFRRDENSYFYGECQWDNYGLYSYFDLSKIQFAKEQYYNLTQTKFNNIHDPTYGFLHIINKLIIRYTEFPCTISETLVPIDKWICENLPYFLSVLQKIKESFIAFRGKIINYTYMIRLKENIMILGLSYDIWQAIFLFQMVKDVYIEMYILPLPTDEQIILAYAIIIPGFDIENFYINKEIFKQGIIYLISDLIIKINPCIDNDINRAVDKIYGRYNETEINALIYILDSVFNTGIIDYSFINYMNYFYNIYILLITPVQAYINMIVKINEAIRLIPTKEIQNFNDYPIDNLDYKNIIYQIIPLIEGQNPYKNYLNLIPFNVVGFVSVKMNQELDTIVDELPVKLIDYQKNMIPRRKINPLLSGYLTFNSYNILPENADGLWWSEVQAYKYVEHTPSVGINLHSWALQPLINLPTGAANLNRIDDFRSILDVHPLISNAYPATIVSIILSDNILRVMSGMNGKAWQTSSVHHNI
uniref:Major capsid protein C-terminal domain-containing protein n=1 Tax=viral metagenome TaxID=1070528 RepID=A0A6C0LUC2_9ZZZZ